MYLGCMSLVRQMFLLPSVSCNVLSHWDNTHAYNLTYNSSSTLDISTIAFHGSWLFTCFIFVIMFSCFSFYNHAVLMDVSLGIIYKLFYYCMFLLYKLSLSLYSIHSRVYSSLKDCFYPQLKAHCKTDNHPSHGYHHRTDSLMMISIHCYHRHLYFYKPRQNSFTSASVSFGFVFQDLLYTHEELL